MKLKTTNIKMRPRINPTGAIRRPAGAFLHSFRVLASRLRDYVSFVYKKPTAIVSAFIFVAAFPASIAISPNLSEKREISLKVERFMADIDQVDEGMLAVQGESAESLLRAVDYADKLFSSHPNRQSIQLSELDEGKTLNRIARSKLVIKLAKERALNPQTPALQETLKGCADDEVVFKDLLDRFDLYYKALEGNDPILLERFRNEGEREAQNLDERIQDAVEKSTIRNRRIHSLVKEMEENVRELNIREANITLQELVRFASAWYSMIFVLANALYFLIFWHRLSTKELAKRAQQSQLD